MRYRIDMTNMTSEDILEEILCDAHAGIEVTTHDKTGAMSTVDFKKEANAALKKNGKSGSKSESGAKYSYNEAQKDFVRNYSGSVSSYKGVNLSNSERKFISSEIKSGRGRIDADGLSGSVSNTLYSYFFDTIGDSVVVTDKLKSDELNVHKEEYSYGIHGGAESNNQNSGIRTEQEGRGQGHGDQYIGSLEKTRKSRTDDRMASDEQSDGERDLREVEGDRESVTSPDTYSQDYEAWRNYMKDTPQPVSDSVETNYGVENVGDSVVKTSRDTWDETDKEGLINDLVAAGYTKNQTKRWVDFVNSVSAVIAADKARLDYESASNHKMLKKNQEYYYTLDASTLCAKRLL